jgi:putative intracellular protease/amidase
MRVSLAAFCLVICTTMAAAQSQSEDKKPGDSPHSTGRTVLPDDKGAKWEDSEVVVDQGVITSRNPGDLEAFSAKIIEEVKEGRHTQRSAA